MSTLHLIRLRGVSILEQLQLEEALLRTDKRNFCLLNSEAPPAIVMGISAKREELIDEKQLKKRPVPLIKRFSGGGTVVVDKGTHFISLICNSSCSGTAPLPKEVLFWTHQLLTPLFVELDFQLQENDFAHGNRKFGGNAQYLCKERWLHHSTLLWDFNPEMMDYLLLPKKMPAYRKGRSHRDFLFRLKEQLPCRQLLEERLLKALYEQFQVEEITLEELSEVLMRPHRKATMLFPG